LCAGPHARTWSGFQPPVGEPGSGARKRISPAGDEFSLDRSRCCRCPLAARAAAWLAPPITNSVASFKDRRPARLPVQDHHSPGCAFSHEKARLGRRPCHLVLAFSPSSTRSFSNTVVPVENQLRTYWWCSPPRIGRQTICPARSTVRENGASFPKARCVRAPL
jgi:hypothetical protein